MTSILGMEINRKDAIISFGLFLVSIFAFAYAFEFGFMYDDWVIYRRAALNILNGRTPYSGVQAGFFNPPWVAITLIPFSIFPFEIGAGLMAASTLVIVILLCRRYNLSLLQTGLMASSPMVIYTIQHSQIDAIVLAGVFLPVSWWPVVAVSKPQVAIALGFHALKKEYLVPAIKVTFLVVGLSILLFGFWPGDMFGGLELISNMDWNMWLNFWPKPFWFGTALILMGISKNDERFFLAASPMMFPYAAFSSFLGLWIVIHSELEDWQSILFFIVSWVVTFPLELGL